MKKSGAILLIAGSAVIMFVIIFIGIGNSLVTSAENVRLRKGNIETALQQRADLIPNLVSTVKGYAQHEEAVFTAVSDARAAIAGAIRSGEVSEMSAASDQLDSALSRLLVVVEAYPQLQSSENFIGLQDELAGMENRLRVAREYYNEAVREYNRKVQVFPSSLVASMRGFTVQPYFEATESSRNAPVINFSYRE